jgi:hypothetical protein
MPYRDRSARTPPRGVPTATACSWQKPSPSDERLGRIGAELIDHRFTELRPREGDREPDDVPVVLTVERGGKQLHQAKPWHGDRYQDEDLDAALTLVDSLVSEITGGKLSFGG